MSFIVTGWVAAQRGMPKGTKLLLLMIAQYADDAGRAFPRQNLLATDCQLSKRAIADQLAQLEEDGWISRRERRRADGGRSSDLITIQFSRGVAIDMQARAEEARADDLPPLVANCMGGGEADDRGPMKPGGGQEPVIEPVGAKAPKGTPAVSKASKESIDRPALKAWVADQGIKLTDTQIDDEINAALDWCSSKGRVQKDWMAFLRNWLRKRRDGAGLLPVGPSQPPRTFGGAVARNIIDADKIKRQNAEAEAVMGPLYANSTRPRSATR